MLLTILMPTLNCASTIACALDSVISLESTLPGQIELIIGDGGSSDGTLAIIDNYIESYAFVRRKNLPGYSIPKTLNVLITKATGRFFTILNGDDYLDVDGVLTLLNSLSSMSDGSIACGNVEVQDTDGQYKGIRKSRAHSLAWYMSVNHPGMISPTILTKSVGAFNESCPSIYDYEWVLRCYKANSRFIEIDCIVAFVRLGGISQTRAKKAAKEIFDARRATGDAWLPMICLLSFYGKFFLKKAMPKTLRPALVRIYRSATGSIDKY